MVQKHSYTSDIQGVRSRCFSPPHLNKLQPRGNGSHTKHRAKTPSHRGQPLVSRCSLQICRAPSSRNSNGGGGEMSHEINHPRPCSGIHHDALVNFATPQSTRIVRERVNRASAFIPITFQPSELTRRRSARALSCLRRTTTSHILAPAAAADMYHV